MTPLKSRLDQAAEELFDTISLRASRSFWKHVKTGGGCWTWTCNVDQATGYGRFWFEGKLAKYPEEAKTLDTCKP